MRGTTKCPSTPHLLALSDPPHRCCIVRVVRFIIFSGARINRPDLEHGCYLSVSVKYCAHNQCADLDPELPPFGRIQRKTAIGCQRSDVGYMKEPPSRVRNRVAGSG